MKETHPFVQYCGRRSACDEGLRYVKRFRSPGEWWERGTIARYMAWLVVAISTNEPGQWYSAVGWKRLEKQLRAELGGVGLDYDGPSAGEIRRLIPQCPWKRGKK